MGSMFDLTYNITLNDNIDEKMLIKLQNVQKWIKMIEKKKKYDGETRYF